MGFEQAVVRTSLTMIRRFGTNGTFHRATGIDYDPSNGGVAVAEESYSATMLVGPVDRKLLNPMQSTTQVTLSASGLGYEPQAGDKVTAHGKTYVVREVRKVYAIGVLALYVLGVTA